MNLHGDSPQERASPNRQLHALHATARRRPQVMCDDVLSTKTLVFSGRVLDVIGAGAVALRLAVQRRQGALECLQGEI
jgi:hypothetical protein